MTQEERKLRNKINELEVRVDRLLKRLQIAEDLNFQLFEKNTQMLEYVRALEDLQRLRGICDVSSQHYEA
jgi:hypothetical protein